MKFNEIRLDRDSELDDIVIDDISMVHLERLGDYVWWLGIYDKDGVRTTFQLFKDKRRIVCDLVENGLETKLVKWKEPKNMKTIKALRGEKK